MKRSVLAMVLLTYAGTAAASGDPAVLYWIGRAALVQLALLFLILVSFTFREFKTLSSATFLVVVAAVWAWGLSSTAPVAVVSAGLMLVPFAAVLLM